jgi:UDP-arabinose 4-epimerase
MTKTVFVTGGAGYVGAHCCKAFSRAGWRVVVFDNLSNGHRAFVRWGELIEGDILDAEGLTAAMIAAKPDAVAHFAALIEVGESVKDPGRYYANNSFGALNILEAMRKAGTDKIVFSSTCATYGKPQRSPLDESHPQSPINPYGWSKLFVEKMLADYSSAHALRFAALRYFNAAGADADGEIGESHDPESHVIPLAIRGASDPNYAFTIFGDDFETRDGTCVRDYIHVADLADAHVKALEYLAGGGASDAFNLGTGVGTTVKEIADAVERASGKPLARKVGPRRAGDPPALVASPEKALRVLGWKATQSDVDHIISTAWAWHHKQG